MDMDFSGLFNEVVTSLTPNAWTSPEKAQTLAALVLALRPNVVVEIGVWQGDSLIPQLLALAALGTGRGVAIDPWSSSDSIVDQTPENVEWWGKVNHDQALARFVARLQQYEVDRICQIRRARSDDVDPRELGTIDILHVDGNHMEQAERDVTRFAPQIRSGGILVLDDLYWSGGHVVRAREHAESLGFDTLYPLGTGCVMQRSR